jgi:hypothetical protein
MAGLLLLGLSTRARADLQITLNGSSTAVHSGNDTVSAVGLNAGGVSITQGGGTGEAILGPATMDLSTLSVTGTSGSTATIVFSMNNIHSPLGQGLLSETLTSHFVNGSGTVAYTTYGDNTNTLHTTTPVVSPPTVTSTGTVTTLNGSSTGPFTATGTGSPPAFSMTEVLVVTFTGTGTLSFSSDASSNFTVPEPGSIALALSGLPVLGLAWARRRRTRA